MAMADRQLSLQRKNLKSRRTMSPIRSASVMPAIVTLRRSGFQYSRFIKFGRHVLIPVASPEIMKMQISVKPHQGFPLSLGVVGCVGLQGYCSLRKRNNPSVDDSTRRSGVLPTHCAKSFMVSARAGAGCGKQNGLDVPACFNSTLIAPWAKPWQKVRLALAAGSVAFGSQVSAKSPAWLVLNVTDFGFVALCAPASLHRTRLASARMMTRFFIEMIL